MPVNQTYRGGENFDLRQMLLCGKHLPLDQRAEMFTRFLTDLSAGRQFLQARCIATAADREVVVFDPYTQKEMRMLMFGSNNYLGLANHPHVMERVRRALQTHGAGIGGPPLLNGYTSLHRELEERLAAFKGTEDAMVFSTGYGANVGLVTALVNPSDKIYYDAYSHASFCDGIKMVGVTAAQFPHNDVDKLRTMIESHSRPADQDVFVGVEGVYSMDGDLAPIPALANLCKAHRAILILDDAHGSGVMGARGRGTAEHFGMEGEIDVSMGTFSKTFAVVGGFVAASRPIINYLRFFARSYMFSASLPPTVIASVLAGLDVIEQEPELLARLWENIRYTASGLKELGFEIEPESGIIPLRVPTGMNIREAASQFHQAGIFVNSIEYPAVPISQQRFRISLMATHTKRDINRLLETVEEVWHHFAQNDAEHGSTLKSRAA